MQIFNVSSTEPRYTDFKYQMLLGLSALQNVNALNSGPNFFNDFEIAKRFCKNPRFHAFNSGLNNNLQRVRQRISVHESKWPKASLKQNDFSKRLRFQMADQTIANVWRVRHRTSDHERQTTKSFFKQRLQKCALSTKHKVKSLTNSKSTKPTKSRCAKTFFAKPTN